MFRLLLSLFKGGADASPAPYAPEDPTVELDVPATARYLQSLNVPERPIRALRPAAALAASGVLALVMLGLLDSTDQRASANAALSLPAIAALPVVIERVNVLPAAAAGSRAAKSRLVTHTITPSLARRECLAQVESARLFLGIAQRSASPSAYTRLTNLEIKRMAASRPIGPYTLQHIAQEMWDRRAESERAATWWSRQYARCEEARVDGSAYVVRG